jgi:type I restriction enzyme S subunit
MELRPGYKQTEVGIRPEDWQIKPLGQFVALRRGHDLTERSRRKGEVPVMGSAGHNGFHNIAVVRGPGVVLGRSGASFGQAHYCPTDFWPHNTALYVTDFFGNQPLFAFYFLKSIDFTRHNSGGAQQSLNRNFIGPIPVSIPDRKEQRAIAEALSDADALIESLKQLLAKKRQVKQGSMQELLTGKKRLSGFTGDWSPKVIGDLLQIHHGKSQHGVESLYGPYPILATGGQIGNANRFLCDHPSVLIGRKGTIDKPQYMDEPFWCVDTLFYSTVFEPNIPKFLFYCFCLIPWKQYNEASGVPSLNARTIEQLELIVPSGKEQEAIAAVLSDLDAEIAAFESRLIKARQIKQGMMQELLTGRIRLIRPSAEVLSFPAKVSASVADVSHNTHFNEAVVIAVLSAKFGSETFPLGRFRRTKFSYLLHRHVEHEAAGFLKKAAGPYNPRTRYGGAEKIALHNQYVHVTHTAKGEGFVADENIAQAEGYFEKWYEAEALTWLEQFRYQKNDALELLSTVDMASEELSSAGKVVTTSAVKRIIQDSPEWKAKLNRSVFSDDNIAATIQTCRQLFSR